jgi:hypothetical protein
VVTAQAFRRAALTTLRRAICERFRPGRERRAWLTWGRASERRRSERGLRAASSFSARAANRCAFASSGGRKDGFSSFLARSPSWYAIARHAVAAVASSASVRSRGMEAIFAPARVARPCSPITRTALYSASHAPQSFLRRPMKPTPTSPRANRVSVAGSGTPANLKVIGPTATPSSDTP